MSPSVIEPVSGSCSVAMVRISVDLPAPLGPRRPYIPRGMSRLTLCRARTPLVYVLEMLRMARCIGPGSSGGGRGRWDEWFDRDPAVRGAADGGVRRYGVRSEGKR